MSKAITRNPLFDPVAERLVLSALIKYGTNVFYDVNTVINDQDFFAPENKLIFSAITNCILTDNLERPDVGAILGAINNIDKDAISRFDLTDYVTALGNESILSENVKPFYEKVGRLALARNLKDRMLDGVDKLNEITGKESMVEIIGKAEAPIIDFTNTLVSNNDVGSLADGLDEYLDNVVNNAGKYQGIPTGFPIFDQILGGGLRKAGVHLIGARAKGCKSFMLHNIALQLSRAKVPVLILDTELTKEMVLPRILGSLSGVNIKDIEGGTFIKNKEDTEKIRKATKWWADNQYIDYLNVSGQHHTEIISIIRKWILRKVGFNPDGSTKDCLIILDYIKMMDLRDAKSFAEHQYLGQMLTDYHNLMVKYNTAMLSAVQLNRDGIEGEDQNVIAGSDRIIALCSSFTILKKKTESDLAGDPPQFGDRKLVGVAYRFGPGLDRGEYINIISKLNYGRLEEGSTNIQNKQNRNVAPNSNTGQLISNDPSAISI